MMHSINPRILTSDAVALLTYIGPRHRLFELFGESGVQGIAVAAKSLEPRKSKTEENNLAVGDEVLALIKT